MSLESLIHSNLKTYILESSTNKKGDRNCGPIPKMLSAIDGRNSTFTLDQMTRALCILISSLGLYGRREERVGLLDGVQIRGYKLTGSVRQRQQIQGAVRPAYLS